MSHTHRHHVGQPIQYFECCESDPMPGQILLLHEDGHTACLLVWCPEDKEFVEIHDVPHFDPVDDNGHYYLALHDEDTPDVS